MSGRPVVRTPWYDTMPDCELRDWCRSWEFYSQAVASIGGRPTRERYQDWLAKTSTPRSK